jgi:D-ribulokinase
LIAFHPASPDAASLAQERGVSLPVLLADLVLEKIGAASEAVEYTQNIHVVPEFLGNRAPLANPHARALIAGLGMENDLDSLLALYIAGICSIGYGLRQIIDVQDKAGANIDNIIVSGGAGQHPLIRQLLADTTGKTVIATRSSEPVLLGAAILAACAGNLVSSVSEGMSRYSAVAQEYQPDRDYLPCHQRRFAAFQHLQQSSHQLSSLNLQRPQNSPFSEQIATKKCSVY